MLSFSFFIVTHNLPLLECHSSSRDQSFSLFMELVADLCNKFFWFFSHFRFIWIWQNLVVCSPALKTISLFGLATHQYAYCWCAGGLLAFSGKVNDDIYGEYFVKSFVMVLQRMRFKLRWSSLMIILLDPNFQLLSRFLHNRSQYCRLAELLKL